jgi:hypothetical protein
MGKHTPFCGRFQLSVTDPPVCRNSLLLSLCSNPPAQARKNCFEGTLQSHGPFSRFLNKYFFCSPRKYTTQKYIKPRCYPAVNSVSNLLRPTYCFGCGSIIRAIFFARLHFSNSHFPLVLTVRVFLFCHFHHRRPSELQRSSPRVLLR